MARQSAPSPRAGSIDSRSRSRQGQNFGMSPRSFGVSPDDLGARLYRQGGAEGPAGLPRLVSSTGRRTPFAGGSTCDPGDGANRSYASSVCPTRPSTSMSFKAPSTTISMPTRPSTSMSGAVVVRRPGSRQAVPQVMVPHTNYRPITLPGMETGQPTPRGGGSASQRLSPRLIGTRNATLPITEVGSHNIPSARSVTSVTSALATGRSLEGEQSQHRMAEQQSTVGGGAFSGQTGAGEGMAPIVNPYDPSWIKPAEFVEFILNHESLTEEFCYMNRTGPYEFDIIPFAKINPLDYMTISIRGVTHYMNGEFDFQDLSEWQRDQEMFRKIVKIPFFDKYQRWKSFSAWKGAMRNHRVQKCSQTLIANLFSLDQTLCEPLLRCRALCTRITTWNLLDLSPATTYTLSEFMQTQRDKSAQVVQELEEIWSKIKDELYESCTASLQLFLKANGFGSGRDNRDDPISGRGGTNRIGSRGDQSRSKVDLDHLDEDAETAMSYTERATTRTQCRKLTKFIRMVQYLFNDAIAQMIQFTAQRLLEALDVFEEEFCEGAQDNPTTIDTGGQADPKRQGNRKPNFVIQCTLEPYLYRFDPDGALILKSMEQSLRNALRATTRSRAFLEMEDFDSFTAPLAEIGDSINFEDHHELYALIDQDPAYASLLRSIEHRFQALFFRVTAYAAYFDHFVEIYEENDQLEDCSITYANATLDDFRSELAKFKGQTEEIVAFPRTKDIGFFRLDCKQMQETLLPSPARCKELLAEYIPMLARQNNDELTGEILAANDRLSQYPNNVDDYVEFQLHLRKVEASLPNLERRYLEVQEMAEIIREYNIRIDKDARAAMSDLTSSVKQLFAQVLQGKERAESDLTFFSKALESDIPELHSRVEKQVEQLNEGIFFDTGRMAREGRASVLERLDDLEKEVQQSVDDAARFNHYQDVLKVDPTAFTDVDAMTESFACLAKLWRSIGTWEDLSKEWIATSFGVVDVDSITNKVLEYNKIASQSSKAMPNNDVPTIWGTAVSQFKNTLPVVVALRNTALKPRHWEVITAMIGHEIDLSDKEFTLGKLLDMGVDQHMETIQDISGKATAELALEEMLERVRKTWDDQEVNVVAYKDAKDSYIIGAVEELVVALEDSLVTISTIAGSRFVAPIRSEVEEWQKNLLLLQETLDEWFNVQRMWMYLESIFGAGDIKKQLPSESGKFMQIDQEWRHIMKETHNYPIALKAALKPGRLDFFKQAAEELDQIQKQLDDYLLSKCIAFPRFFFLSNDELLDVLSQARRPQAVQVHLHKCFDNVCKLSFGDEQRSNDIMGMISAEGEAIPFLKPLKARSNVEKWLSADGGVEDFMVRTVRESIKKGHKEYTEMKRKDWVKAQHCQVMITVGAVSWTEGTESVFRHKDPNQQMNKWFNKNESQLMGLIDLIRDYLSPVQRKGVVALITQDVHNRDIIETLYIEKVCNIMNFKWQQQLRYYWDSDLDDCCIRQVDAQIVYGHEYQGALSRLVITPLTDRCWMTITGALHIKLGAAPQGPAGTGKTESTKDLAKGIARMCVVFNCSDQINYQMMGKLYSGVVSAGVWVCLDEFNRISIEVLSVIAQQVGEIRQALLQGVGEMLFEGRLLKVKSTCGIFITMNPGYAGRTELPDNLKVMFRPVAMMVPNYTLIAEIMLYAEGYSAAKALCGKFTKLFALSAEQLSKQDHYDFGMRAVKSVLVMAGSLKRSEPEEDEPILLIRAMRDANIPKFLSSDLPLFFAIIADLFPERELPPVDHGELKVEIETTITRQGLQVHDHLVLKILQLFETLNVRFGVMLVGPTLAGKTTSYKVLAISLTHLREDDLPDERFQRTRFIPFNPKAISMGELYGEFNTLTQEWSDGLGSKILRGFVADDTLDFKWTVFDGPVDSIWIESMNTVLDDNMTLCLANSERIKFNWSMRIIFEVEDLRFASLATVSRCGMVYLAEEDLGWQPYVNSWIQALPDVPFTAKSKEALRHYFEIYVGRGLEFIRKNCSEPVATKDIQLVTSLCSIFTAVLNETAGTAFGTASKVLRMGTEEDSPLITKPKSLSKMDPTEFEAYLLPVFCFAFTWSIGGSGDLKSRKALAPKIEEWFKKVTMPRDGSAYDGWVNFYDGVKLKSWDELVPSFQYKEGLSFFQFLVPNNDTIRFAYIMDRMLSVQSSVFLTGVSGVGKSVIISNLLENMKDTSSIVPMYITFSAQTKAAATQLTIESKLERKRKALLGAPAGKMVVVFVDDVNMPIVEEQGAQPPIELLRQFQDLRGFFDRKKLEWKDVENTTLLLCAAPPGGGRSSLTKRFTRHSHLLAMTPTSAAAMTTIFGSILAGFLQRFKSEIQHLANASVAATIDLYNRAGEELLPTPARPHYTFNLRDISKVFQGLLMAKPIHVPNASTFTRLWYHEIARVFCDRLICEEDKQWFMKVSGELLKTKFRLPDCDSATWRNIMWCDFLRPVESRVYEEARDMPKVNKQLEAALDDYNVSHTAKMNLVFFTDCVHHISRSARVFRQPRGNLLLVGVGGSGRSSCARLCAFMAEAHQFEITLSKGYGIDGFREDEKKFLIAAGAGQAKLTMFLMNDTQIIDETFLEDLNNVLNAGEVPNLFPSDEVERVISDTRDRAKNCGRSEARDAIWSFFVESVRENLRIVMTMSPVGPALRTRVRMFPALKNCCTIDWFLPWPNEALLSVSTRQLWRMPRLDKAMRDALAAACCNLHQQVLETAVKFDERLRRKVYVTPKSYLDLISLYVDMLSEKHEEKEVRLKCLEMGLNKIDEANAVVGALQEELTKMAPFIDEKIIEADELVPVVTEEKKKAEVVQEKVANEEAIVRSQAAEVRSIQEEAQRELDVAMPALEAALKSLDALDKKDIGEMKNYQKPPTLVMLTMEAVNTLLQEKTDWDTAKRVLTDGSFLQRLKTYDKDNIPGKVLKALGAYVNKPEYTPDQVGNQSKAAKSLCQWTFAMDTYSKVAKDVEPKKQKVAELNVKLQEAEGALREKQTALQEILDKVNGLQKRLDDTLTEKDRLEQMQALTKARLERADILTVGLADEAVRWEQIAEQTRVDIVDLIGDAFLSAASISYYGPFTGNYRADIVEAWVACCLEKRIPCKHGFDLRMVMGNPVQIREWNLQGLPADSVSVNNGVLVVRAKRWPLMIDPQSQGNKWIKKKNQGHLKTIKLTSPKMLLLLEQCISTGAPLLMEDVGEHLDPALEPLLVKAMFHNNGRLQIRLGDQDIDYDSEFLFYMTTKLPNPHYFPEVFIKVTVINFTVTFEGLEEQLLSEVVSKELPEVLTRRVNNVLQLAEDKKVLQQLEDKILKLLSDATGNILDDEVLISTLAGSKATSRDVNTRVEAAEVASIEIEHACAEYNPVATCGAILYFVVADLANINPMYQFSLFYFVQIFNRCIELAGQAKGSAGDNLNDDQEEPGNDPDSGPDDQENETGSDPGNAPDSIPMKDPDDELDIRVQQLQHTIISNVFTNVSRGLFEDSKLTTAFMIATSFQRHYHEVSHNEWYLLLRGANMLDLTTRPSNPDTDIFTEKMWDFIYCIEVTSEEHCDDLCEQLADDPAAWQQWACDDNPHVASLPEGYEETNDLHYFHVLLLLKALCPEKLILGIQEHVCRSLGESFIVYNVATMEELYADSLRNTPIVFVLSPGADPTSMLQRFAASVGRENNLAAISLGQGQDVKAARMVDNACKSGDWVLLQNCHLCRTFMPMLERICEGLEDVNLIHKEFRLFLTSMPVAYFPVLVLQNGIKLTIEPPRGLRANVMRSLQSLTDDQLSASSKPSEWRKIQYGLKFFHAVVQERRKFGPLGWNIHYEFNDSDLETSTTITHNMLELEGEIPWETLLFVIGHINYGGRVTDDLDRRCLLCTLELFITPKILDPEYTFSASGLYKCPPRCEAATVDDFRAWADQVPLIDQPEVFGMHENANISFMQQESESILNTILSIQPREAPDSGGKSAEDTVLEIVSEQLSNLPPPLTMEDAHPTCFEILEKTGLMKSLGTCLLQEMARFNILLAQISSTLIDQQKAIKGVIVMTSELDDMFNSEMNNQVPELWTKGGIGYPSLKPLGSWLEDLIARVDFFRDWIEHGQPMSFWISSFYFPQGFLTSVLQGHSREQAIPVDVLTFEFIMMDTSDASSLEHMPPQGICIHGLFMEGASWDYQEKVIAVQELGVTFVDGPLVNLVPTQDKLLDSSKFSMPVYKTSLRRGELLSTGHSTNYVLSIEVETSHPPNFWVLSGAAFLTMLND